MFRPQTIDRLTELDQLRRTRQLTRQEQVEFESLWTAAQSPEVLAARAENDQLLRQFQLQQQKQQDEVTWQRLFETVINGQQPIDTIASREEIKSWLHPGETFTDPRSWFTQVLKENPDMAKRISWKKHLTKAEQQAQADSDARALQAHFRELAQSHGLSECTSNFSVWSSANNPVVAEIGGEIGVIDDAGDFHKLVPATELEKQNWEQERFEAHQQELRDAQRRNDIPKLKQLAKQEWNEKHNPATTRLERLHTELRSLYERDQAAGLSEPLPQLYTREKLLAMYSYPDQVRQLLERYGNSRLTARLQRVESIPDGNGGTIQF